MEMLARMVVETGTSTFYKALKSYAQDLDEPILSEIAANISKDEIYHYNMFEEGFKKYNKEEKLSRTDIMKVIYSRLKEVNDEDVSIAFKHICPDGSFENFKKKVKDFAKVYYPYKMSVKMLIRPLLLVNFADHAGYIGVYLYMLLVGTFIPVPSEILLIPSGYLASIGQKSFSFLLISGAIGSLSGAVIQKVNSFFKKHGAISVFLAPLTPGMGQYISIPAGLSYMSLKKFIPLTLTSNIIWVGFMLLIGYIFGEGENAHKNSAWLSLILFGFVIISVSIYVFIEIRKEKGAN